MHKIENKKLKIDIFGVVYDVSKPKAKDAVLLAESLQQEGMLMSKKTELLFEKLVSYGIPESVLNELDYDAFLELMEIINGSKKN